MLLAPRTADPLERLANRLGRARKPDRALIDDIMTAACTRLPALQTAGKTRKLEEWCRSGAWLDAALALVAPELPDWTVRRIGRDDGLWFCSLSRSPNFPIEIDNVAEASHETMPLAILAAFVEAKRSIASTKTVARSSSSLSSTERQRICCDNFS